MENKRFIECVRTGLQLQLLLLFPLHCIASQPESNFPKSPAFCESAKHYCRLHSVHDTMQCTQSLHRFRDQSTGYHNGCFSAVNRVKHLYSDNFHLNVMGIRSSKYGWNFINAHRWFQFWLEQGFLDLAWCAVAFFGWVFPGSITQTCEFVATNLWICTRETSHICHVYFLLTLRFFVTDTARMVSFQP